MRKRHWCYCQKPSVYSIRCNRCGGSDITWSEFEKKIWCYTCEKDLRGTAGIFDFFIPLQVAKMLGISFDRIEIPSGKLMKIKITKTGKLYWRKEPEGK